MAVPWFGDRARGYAMQSATRNLRKSPPSRNGSRWQLALDSDFARLQGYGWGH